MLSKKDLVKELVLRNLKVRYSRPALGFFWAFLSPLLVVATLYLVFSVILQVKIKEAPFILYLMSAVFPWKFFQDSVLSSATSLIDNKNLIKESNIPQYLIPLSVVLANAVNFLPSLLILLLTAAFYLKGLPFFIVLLPIILAVHFIATMGVSLAASILYIKFRDIKYILEAVLQILFYLTPAFYPLSLIKESFGAGWFAVYINNPFVGILNLYRLTVLKGFYPAIKGTGAASIFLVPLGFAIVILTLSFSYYQKNKTIINDYLSY